MNITSSIQSSILRIADDFGVDDHHDMVMLRLLNNKKIDGVSVFSDLISQTQINELMSARSQQNIQIGLHFNLTHGALLPGVSRLLLRSISDAFSWNRFIGSDLAAKTSPARFWA